MDDLAFDCKTYYSELLLLDMFPYIFRDGNVWKELHLEYRASPKNRIIISGLNNSFHKNIIMHNATPACISLFCSPTASNNGLASNPKTSLPLSFLKYLSACVRAAPAQSIV
ncbi:hypothetical protein ACFE04_001597 [Oxalis oulophora]